MTDTETRSRAILLLRFTIIPALMKVTGWLLLTALMISMAHGFHPQFPLTLAAFLYSLAALFLFYKLVGIQQLQVLLLIIIGLILIGLSGGDVADSLMRALTANHEILALIISVGFLQLIIKPNSDDEKRPTGKSSLWKTILGVYFFAAVINLSAIVIFGDRLQKKDKLHKTQVMILSRMFGANALWSPFFVSMGAALIYSNGAKISDLIIIGLVMAMISIIITGLQVTYELKKQNETFEGYPMHIDSLLLPAILSILVMLAHVLLPDISILILVCAVVLVTVVVTLFMKHSVNDSFEVIRDHTNNGINRSAGEILLFLSAGLFGVGVSLYTATVDFQLPIMDFTNYDAAVTLIGMVVISFLGVHPIISISVLGGLLAPLSPDPKLLGMMFIFSWGVSIPLSPLSAISLLLQSRYHVKASTLVSLNAGFTMLMLTIACLFLIMFGG